MTSGTVYQALQDKAAAARLDALSKLPSHAVCAACNVEGSTIEPTYLAVNGETRLGGILKCQACGNETNFVPDLRNSTRG
jgi:hypothetical protein